MRNALIFLAFLLFRLILSVPALKEPSISLRINPDADHYHALGLNMARNSSFSRAPSPPYVPDGLRTPLYPTLIGISDKITGDPIRPVVFLQAILWALMGMGIMIFAEKKFGFASGLTSGLLLITSPLSLKYGPSIMSENLFTPALVAGAMVFLRARESGSLRLFALSGLIFGLSALVRPSSLPLGLLLALLVGRPFPKKGLAFLGLWVAPIGMWVIRNWLTFGFPFFSTVFFLNIIAQNAPRVIAVAEGISLKEAEMRVAEDLRERYRADESWFYDPVRLRTMLPYGLEVIKEHPKEYLLLHAKGTALCFLPLDPGSLGITLGFWEASPVDPFELINQAMIRPAEALRTARESFEKFGPLGLTLFVFIILHTLTLYGLATAGAIRLRGEFAAVALSLITVGALVFMTGPLGSPRFRLPAEPFLALLAGRALLSRKPSLGCKRSHKQLKI
ncbi:MAG: glycosyltransferase family 39 protein [candidate division WOR-3 bacterium]